MSPAANDDHSRFVYVAAAISALGGLLFGYDTGVISGAILFIMKDFSLSATVEEIVVGAVLLGAVIGAAIGGRLADRFGRRKVLIVAATVFALAAIGTAIAPTVAWLMIGRTVVGWAIGVASFTAPLYISEVAPADVRGRLVSFNQLALTIGIVVSYLIDYALSGVGGWRVMFGLAAIPAAALGIGMFFMPDSPRWLASHGSVTRARQVLNRIRSTANVDAELSAIHKSLQLQDGEWRGLFKRSVRPALVIGIGLAIFQQVTGINTVIYYAPTIFEFAGFSSASAAILATAGIGAVNVLMTVLAMQLLDRLGRRPLLLLGLAGMILALGVLGLAFIVPNLSTLLSWIAAASLVLYVGSFAIGLGPVFWLIISEIYPLKIRGLGMSTASVANWGSNLLVAVSFLTLIQILGRAGTFWLYALVGIAAWVFSYSLVPETSHRSLEEIEASWRTTNDGARSGSAHVTGA